MSRSERHIERRVVRRMPYGFALAWVISFGSSLQPLPAQLDVVSSIQQAIDTGAYGEAETIARKALDSVEAQSRQESLAVARAQDMYLTALVGNGKGSAPATFELSERTVRLKERLLGKGHPETATSLYNLSEVYAARGQYTEALTICQRALVIRRLTLDRSDSSIADTLDAIANSQIHLERFKEADNTLQQSVQIRERVESAVATARTFELLGFLHRSEGRYADALSALDRARDSRAQRLGDGSETLSALELRGEAQFLSGSITAARATWSGALNRAQRELRPDHPLIPVLLGRLGFAAFSFGNLAEARELRERALTIAETSLFPCQPEAVGFVNALAISAQYAGEYSAARRLFQRALTVIDECRRLSPSNVANDTSATIVFNQGDLARVIGDLAGAERFYDRAIQLWTSGLGSNHPFVARGLDALAETLAERADYPKATALYERALRIRRRVVGPDHPDVAWTLTNIARLTAVSGDVELALARLGQAIGIYQRGGVGDEPDHLARALELRGTLEARHANFPAARMSFAEALAMRERIFGAGHPLVAEARADVAGVDFALGEPGRALMAALDAERIGRDHLHFTIRYLPERQAMEYAQKRPKGLDLALSVVATGLAGQSYRVVDSVIQSRGVILDELGARARSAASSDPELGPLNAAVSNARERFANLMLRSFQGDEPVPRALLDRTRQEKEDAERALAERSIAVRTELERAGVGLDEVRNVLPARSVLVSFVRYERTFLSTTQPQSVARKASEYIAFIIRAGSADVESVPLGAATSLDALVSEWRSEAGGRAIAAGIPAIQAERTYRAVGSRLRQRIWDPIAGRLEGASQVFIVPDGALNLVSFAALPVDGNKYLVETAPVLHYLSTERDVIPTTAAPGRGLLAVGGPAYDLQARVPAQTAARRSGCGSVGGLRFEDLPGTRAEVQDIARIWSGTPLAASAGAAPTENVTVLSGQAASKSAVIGASVGRRIVHLATHGFFLGSDCNAAPANTRSVGGLVATSPRAPVLADSPLLLAGLAFAGANTRGDSRSGRDDGILTAEEVAGLNLQGTEWVVLSACDTGLGEIRAGEGVFGLRRAFQIAGARTVIMSLWSVEDQSTRTWMRALYEGRFERHLSTADAVHDASLRILQSRRAAGQTTHPFYWAAFVAAGDWK